jgi:hypothetical protein
MKIFARQTCYAAAPPGTAQTGHPDPTQRVGNVFVDGGRSVIVVGDEPQNRCMRECSGPDCVDTAVAHGLCPGHLSQRKTGSQLRPKRRNDPSRGCRVASCTQKHEAKNLCRAHYRKALEYRLTADDLAALCAIPACEICGQAFRDAGGTGQVRCIDHDAVSGLVRGALCNRCNLGIGKFAHDRVVLRAAAGYVEASADGRLPVFTLEAAERLPRDQVPAMTPCAFDGCEFHAYARGLCHAHWNRARQELPLAAVLRRERPGEECAFPGCGHWPVGRGLCRAHYMQQSRGQSLRPARRRTAMLRCKVAECEKPGQSLGYCVGHYSQVYVHGAVQGALRYKDPTRGCNVPWCPGQHRALGLCNRHYAAMLRLGLSPDQAASAYSVSSCPICMRAFDEAAGRGRHGDHDHVTGRFRAVICEGCNLGLGLLDHDPDRLRSAATYIRRAEEFSREG